MLLFLKKIFSSRIFRIIISLILIYLAFRKVNIIHLIEGLKSIPIWFVVANIFYGIFTTALSSYRWSLFLVEKPNLKDVWNFTKAGYIGAFYTLFSPTGAAADLWKWVPLINNYPDLTKGRLMASVVMDRIIGTSAFITVGFIAIVIGKFTNFVFPAYLFWMFLFLFLGVIFFNLLVFNLDFSKFLPKSRFLQKVIKLLVLFKQESKSKLFYGLFVAFLIEFSWIIPVWVIGLVVGAEGLTLLPVFMFMPIIALLLILPISIGGFGGREFLFLFFFSQIGVADEKILLTSTFIGIMGIINTLFGGLFLFF